MATIKDILGNKYKEGMTAEEIAEALRDIDIHAGYVPKATLDSATSDAAAWKKKYNDKLTDEEKQKQEHEDVVRELAQLKRNNAITEHASKLIESGYRADLARASAEALLDGKVDVFLANQQTYLAERDAAAKKQKMKDMTPPPAGGGEGGATVTKEQFAKMTLAEREKLYTESPEIYNELKG